MKNLDGIKQGNVLWRVDYLDIKHGREYYFTLDELHDKASKRCSKNYIVTQIHGDRLQQELRLIGDGNTIT